MVKPLTVYKASAGSGKTFTLATEYIKLLILNPQSYRNILAVTFTNKATEEMKMRILSQLYGIWKQLPDSRDYLKVLCEKTGQTEAYVSARAGIALELLLHNYNYFRVMTIDTFFQSVLRNLARELDLTANLRIGLNDGQVEELAVDQMIGDLSTKDVLLQWLMKYILENISDDKSWNVIGQIKSFGKTIFRDDYKKVSQALNAQMAEPHFFEQYTTQLRDIRQEARERMQELAGIFFETLAAEGLAVEDFSYSKGGVCSIFIKLRDEVPFDESIVTKRVLDCVGDPEKWCKKDHPRRDLILTLAETTLGRLLRQVIDERPYHWKRYQSAELTLRHLNQLRLLISIEKKVRELNEDANRFLLSDTQQLLHALIDGSDSPFIFEKIGSQLEHIMIDEFQDTSTVQWQNFKVLLAEAMSHDGAENLIVGDVKQSIYRWRSGDWRLLNDIEKQFPYPAQQLDIRNLDTNYRSQRRIITFNNAFFQTAADLERLALGDSPETEQLKRAYADVCQEVPEERDDSGHVSIRLLTGDDYQDQVLRETVDIVKTLQAEGIQPQKMAILVRSNAYIPLIAQYFTSEMPDVRIVSDEAFRLDASDAVNILIYALRLLTHPQDELTKACLAVAYRRKICLQEVPDNAYLLTGKSLDDLLPEAFIQHTGELTAMSLYELVEKLYAIFGLEQLSGQSAYVCAFFDHLAAFVSENSTDIDTFLSLWEEDLCSKTIQGDEVNGIRLISIHKSKGLEFDNVIIPFCDWQIERSSGNILWCQPKEEPFNALPIVPIDYNQKQMAGTIYEHDYHQEHLQNTVDNLNLLYVAFTRAGHHLFVIGRRGARNSRSTIIEQALPLLTETLSGATLDGLGSDASPLTFEYGSLDTSSRPASQDKPTTNPFLKPVIPTPIHITTFSNKVTFRQSNQSQDFIAGDDEEATRSYIHTGSVLHKVFSSIRTSADVDAALRQLELDGILYDDHNSLDKITRMLRKRLAHPKVASWFSDRWTLFNECAILTYEDGHVTERRPDRVMTDGQEWIVVDFKFGSPKSEYHDQVREYMDLIRKMNGPLTSVKGYLWFVYSNQIEEV